MQIPPFGSNFDQMDPNELAAATDGENGSALPQADLRLAVGRQGRELSLYPATLGYDLQ
jgi:hypothetical protein